ncbi:iron ABC transporter substrate-binding protein [Brachybacterium vulturis]|uniref:Iron ABC transporter substrate-binding protein n=1 Tax=Brachybacterium vulturis TaxID=2017484 RepID=A0A291GIT7_9MICO|nr:extracellular solute-binding protein [Brachybacterium vulturis]ATG50088.1 iron ABC transporter substrate-binding protein [Brachybacterium vulturis]
MLNRRKYLQGTALVGTTAALAACGLGAGGGGDSGSDGGADGGPAPFTIYTARDSELADKVVADFEAANPDWEGMATILTLGAQEALERVRAESTNPQGDIWWGGTRQQLSQGAADGVLAPAPQEVIDAIPENYRDPEGLWIGEMLLAELFLINTDMISGDEVPADWDDLLEEQYAGNIVIRDVEASGTMRAIYCSMIDRLYDQEGSPEPGYEWLTRLDVNTATYAANPTDMYQRVSREEAAISLWNLQDIMLQKHGDFPMFDAVVPASGAPMLVDGLAKIKDGPNGAGADAFISYLMSSEVQTSMAEEYFQIPSIELDAEPDWLADLGLKELEVDWDRIAENEEEWIGHWASNIKGKG